MAKRQRGEVLNRLAGKMLVFGGKFWYGVEDALKALAEAQQGTICDELTDKIDYLVLADLGAGKTIQKKALSLNAKGAAIQVIDADGFKSLAEPAPDEILALFRAGQGETYTKISRSGGYFYQRLQSPKYTFHAEDLRGIALRNVQLDNIHFVACSFVGASFENVRIASATDCDFSNVRGDAIEFCETEACQFRESVLNRCIFGGSISGADFTGACLENAAFIDRTFHTRMQTAGAVSQGVQFTNAKLKSANCASRNRRSTKPPRCSRLRASSCSTTSPAST